MSTGSGCILLFVAVGFAHIIELHTVSMSTGSAWDLHMVEGWLACVQDLEAASCLQAGVDAAQWHPLHLHNVFACMCALAPLLSLSFSRVPYCFRIVLVMLGVMVDTPEWLCAMAQVTAHVLRISGCQQATPVWLLVSMFTRHVTLLL